jgi:hypothetical protein
MSTNGLPFTVKGTLPDLKDPTLIVMLSGWIDASGAASSAMSHIITESAARSLIEFDADTFIDFRARRPFMELREGVNTRIAWNLPELQVGTDDNERDVLLLTGPEPDIAWNAFAEAVAGLAKQLNVSKCIGLGAYPFGAPHTRSVGLTATSPDPSIIDRLTLSKNSLDAPAGVEAIIEHAMHRIGIPAFCLWAQIPHYVSSMAYPAASAALIDALCLETGLSYDTASLRQEAVVQRERLDQLVSNNPDHAEMLGKLEEAYDALHGVGSGEQDSPLEIPSVEDLAAEVEQFLRDQQPGG